MANKKQRSVRQLRVGEELRHILAEILARGDLRDPDLAGRSITVSEVRVSPDMRNATVFVLPLGGGEEKIVVEALGRAASYLRGEVGRKLHLKYLPQLSFLSDDSFDNATQIDKLLADPAVARDLTPQKP
ncbi:MAG TPA: 30S ribosome-binding factor RbfA [Rhodospirillaceae bacterium]|nr:ribosome-binding factor A [Rhodospirillaceae bacterium]HAA91980.1 30S ribosome-binding factor RbfA [Rhodospirillaceae bacterium]HAT36677.1 30S ribosome-binding factor RbfA [Rhodospirillaceae bacterium]